jgi:hypothetical protein
MVESQIVLGWLKRGEDRGEVKSARKFVLSLIRRRFGGPVPEDLALAVEGTNDPHILEEWNLLAGTVGSLAELRKAMKSLPGVDTHRLLNVAPLGL